MIRRARRLPGMAPRTAAALVVAGIAIVLMLGVLVATGASDGFDRAVMGFVRSPELRRPLSFLHLVTELGSTGAVTAVAFVTFLVGAAVGPWLHGLYGALTIGLASIGVTQVKLFIARERPEVLDPVISERGFSFPSGHATLSMTAYGILAVLVMRSRLPRRVKLIVVAIAGVVVFLVGLARVWLGVHYPTDVIAGWTAGAVIVVLYATLTRGVSREPAAAAVDADRAAPRSDPPAAG